MIVPSKAKITTRATLLALEWYQALEALELVFENHTGLRKDGETPEWAHMLFIMQFFLTWRNELIRVAGEKFAEEVIVLAALHDLLEDTRYPEKALEERFGSKITRQLWVLAKKSPGLPKKDIEAYYAEIARDPQTAMVKGGDRFHNITTMGEAKWTGVKQRAYLTETEELVLPMLKKARRAFPQFELVFQNLKLVLMNNIYVMDKHLVVAC